MRILYLGIDPSHILEGNEVTHLPLIKTVALPFTIPDKPYSHIILTSKEAVRYMSNVKPLYIALTIGPGTTFKAKKLFPQVIEAKQFTQEGVLGLIDEVKPSGPLLYPRSIQARPYLAEQLLERGYELDIIDLYDTVPILPLILPDLTPFDRIFFTSPTCVKAFFDLYLGPYLGDKFYPIGPITEKKLLLKKISVEHTSSR